MVNLVIGLICSLVPLAGLICKIGSRFYFDDDHHHRLDARSSLTTDSLFYTEPSRSVQ
ncbi:hypothetical protein T12_5572 [Trichinella patagoniensis]|uniref:Uncharacterized protein n=1 Tax=Trichinella patagoniensis TaxID=990121 RepID=A0A0V1A2H2_9BILA|nr:hypothetical protein T06_7838 [Trichinella sp. T6]KRY18973.1 hypothetical protein T12_5572 [Trichinella patagoniensis]